MIQANALLITRGTFINHQQGTTFKELGESAVLSATHDSDETLDRPKCHENTRVAVLDRLWGWTENRKKEDGGMEEETQKPIIWVYGDAGAGKSALAQTHAERCAGERRLLGSFFFSRNDTQRSTYTRMVATIAYQAAIFVPELKDLIVAAIEHDPSIFKKALRTQFSILIVDPINALSNTYSSGSPPIPNLIIIDGLDECSQENRREQGYILKVISSVVLSCRIGLKVLVASRAESEIRSAFDSNLLQDLSARLVLGASFRPDDDIRLFLNDTFGQIRDTHTLRSHIPHGWPGECVKELVKKSSGQFIYASTAARYISSPRHKPAHRLDIILGLRERASNKDIPFSALDALYCQIFSAIPEEKMETIRNIFGLLIFHNGGAADFSNLVWLRSFLSLTPEDLDLNLMDVVSIVEWKDDRIRITHASLSDFLLDRKRSGQYHLERQAFFTSMAKICVNHFNEGASKRAMEVSLKKFTDFCRDAGQTPDLRECMLKLSLDSVYSWYCENETGLDRESYYSSPFLSFSNFTTGLFELLESMKFGRDLLEYHLNAFDRCMMKLIPKAICGADNLLLITTLSAFPRPAQPDWAYFMGFLFYRSRPFLGSDRPKYSAAFSILYDICTQCAPQVILFFNNPRRSKQYALTDTRYADAALGCLVYLCQNTEGLKMLREITSQEKSPGYFLSAYYALKYLPQLLSRSAASKELIGFVRSHVFQRQCREIWGLTLRDKVFEKTEINNLILSALCACKDYLLRGPGAATFNYTRLTVAQRL